MTIENTHLCASNVLWSAFNVNVIQRGPDAPPIGSPQPVTYGSEIILSDSMTGIATAPLFIKKVDKSRISNDEGGPVSQMQKIALQRVNTDGSRHYLSAAGPVPSTPGGSATTATGNSGTHHLLFSPPRLKEDRSDDGTVTVYDEVDDYLCWTIVGICECLCFWLETRY
jgi:recombining binding protein suppressor of hairless